MVNGDALVVKRKKNRVIEMKIIIEIPDEEYHEKEYEIEKAIDNLHEFLLRDIECEICYEE